MRVVCLLARLPVDVLQGKFGDMDLLGVVCGQGLLFLDDLGTHVV